MFEGREYESYIALCRELGLKREFECGDVWCFWKDVSNGPFIQGASGHDGADELAIWLPRLDQWLELLEREDPEHSKQITIEHREDGWYVARYVADRAAAPTLEESFALLYRAVKDGY
jgi:hypothetical protein